MNTKAANKPFFSIVLPTKDRSFLVKDLLSSVINQDFKDFELIVSDNSEGRETQDFLKTIKDPRVKNLKTGGLNMADNWENAIKNGTGRFLLLFSDKMILKRGSLSFLRNYIKKNNPECVTWTIDSFYDELGIFYKRETEYSDYKISSQELIKNILSSDIQSFDRAPFHCNSCISMDVFQKIRKKNSRICMQLNPDYTMSYQCVLNLNFVHRIDKSLTILRYPDFDGSYGTGNSFMKKTDQADSFVEDNLDWITATGEIEEVPLAGNHFILNLVLKDLYNVLKIYEIYVDKILDNEDRLVSYYLAIYKEIIWRLKMNVDMSKELKIWKEALKMESPLIQRLVIKDTQKKWIEMVFIHFINILKKIPLISSILINFSRLYYRYKGEKFSSFAALLKKTNLEEAKNES